MRHCIASLIVAALGALSLSAQGVDKRLTEKPKHYNLPYHPWTPPSTKEAWEARRAILKEQLLVSQGLWPMPEKTPLNATIHGKIERDEYTVEKVFFESTPGHYVTGNLYRPTGRQGKHPVVLYAHGHWADARLASHNDWAAQMKSGAEATEAGAKHIHQAGPAMLARLGCVVFMYDMVGNSDSKQIAHRAGFTDVDAQLRLQTFMNLQTWNSIRAVDFVTSLPDVDKSRIGVTGASGGGTQSFILAAVDERITAAFPAVMVSASMQGGCICENDPYLRVNTTNIELSALIAPRPLGMTAANDWTKEVETKGLPELKKIYAMYGAEGKVMAKYLSFPHNYNQPSREVMYNFFNEHLKLGAKGPIAEKPFMPVQPKELSVYDNDHPVPKNALNAEALKKLLTSAQEERLQKLVPKDKASLATFQRIEGVALRAMMVDQLPSGGDIDVTRDNDFAKKAGVLVRNFVLSREGQGERVKAQLVKKDNAPDRVVVWVHPDGVASLWNDGKLVPAAQTIVDKGAGIFALEAFRTGATAKSDRPAIGKLGYAGYYFGYNRALVAERVRDVLTGVALMKREGVIVDLVGFDKAGPWVVLARGLCGDAVSRTAADLNGFRFEQVKDFDDEMMLPGALKYGGMAGLAAVIAPHELFLHNAKMTGTGPGGLLQAAYRASGQEKQLHRQEDKAEATAVVTWLLR